LPSDGSAITPESAAKECKSLLQAALRSGREEKWSYEGQWASALVKLPQAKGEDGYELFPDEENSTDRAGARVYELRSA